ncbi:MULTISPECIES: BolA family protein [unclassified Meridianimarinicoccus]|uniref:BolA family protein n=1 Tax=unclassified Meridianimarinicoccus TaxID=2923344 RepID=UPI001867C9F3|nr:BolA family protein [Fluviibacterium sp. MJW13]
MTVAEEIETRLSQAFGPERLEVVDESEMHRGHAGYQEGGQSHFRVQIAAAELAAMSRLQRHRAVHAAIGKDILARIHALALEIDA